MTTVLTIVHVLVCLFLIAIVLLQQGKGADMGAAFGGGSSQTVFGADGPVSLLSKVTTSAAIIFMITSLVLAYISAQNKSGSVMKDLPTPATVEQKVEEPKAQLIETKVEPVAEAPAAQEALAVPAEAPAAAAPQAPAAEPTAAQPAADKEAPAPAQ